MKKLLMGIITVIALLTSVYSNASAKPRPFNRIVAVIDSSGTFRNHQYEAIEKVRSLIDQMSNHTERRYEVPDEIYLVSLDAKPEVIWYGKRPQLDQLKEDKLPVLFSERKKYRKCTDVAAAFNLASHKLNRDPLPAAKWLFVFSDLIDEPPTSDTNCNRPLSPSLPSDEIKWDSLSDTSIGIFWTPDKQIKAWEASLADKGVSIRFYNKAEARNIELPPPPKAKFKMTDEERQEKKEKVKGIFGDILKVAIGMGGIVVIILIGLIVLSRRNNNRRAAGNIPNNNQNPRR